MRRLAAAALLLVLVSACGSDFGSDDGGPATLTLWTRAATEAVSKAYADACNRTHDTEVEVTAFPNEEYPAKLASSARSLPDLFAAPASKDEAGPTWLGDAIGIGATSENADAAWDPQSPWLETVRGALFGDAGTALSDGNTAITESLQQGS